MIYLTDEEILKSPLLKINHGIANGSGNLFLKDNYVYKLFYKDFKDQLNYLKDLPKHPNVLPVIDTLSFEAMSDFQSGYITEYKENAKTFFECFNCQLSYQEKEFYIKQILEAITFLHQYLIIGDIHGDNFFIHNKKAYIYDLDYSRPLNSKRKPTKCKYYVSHSEKRYSTLYTDMIKTYIEFYSFLFEYDISYYIRILDYKKICNLLLNTPLPKEMHTFFKTSLMMLKEKKLPNTIYQTDNFINENILNAEKELKKVFTTL